MRVLVPIAEGVEEIEATTIIDTLRRAGWDVTTAGLNVQPVVASRGVRLVPDVAWDQVDSGGYDVLVLPGGSRGTDNLRRDERIIETIRRFRGDNKWLGAVCAGPLVLEDAGVLRGRNVTCYPALAGKIVSAQWVDRPVVVDGRIITSQGPGTCLQFALTLVGEIGDPRIADRIAEEMLVVRSEPWRVQGFGA